MKRITFGMIILALVAVSVAVAETPRHDYAQGSFANTAKEVPLFGDLQIRGVPLDQNNVVDLDLTRFRVWSPKAQIIIHTANGIQKQKAPANAYFRGTIPSRPDAAVMLTVLASGVTRGYIMEKGRFWFLGDAAEASLPGDRLHVHAVDEAALNAGGDFSCSQGDLHSPQSLISEADKFLASLKSSGTSKARTSQDFGLTHTVVVAIESDEEYLALFSGDTGDAADYAGDIIAYLSVRYGTEVDTSLNLGDVSLWTTTDPWSQSNTICSLFEFGKYWNTNHTGTTRSIAHFLSGRSLGGGVAWRGVLCIGSFIYDITPNSCPGLTPLISDWGGDYGLTAGIDGDFDINSPSVLWDIVATGHEIGHNFSSRHTHCYNSPGDLDPIDECESSECVNGCYCGAESLPGPSGAGSGTIMSYCHLRTGGLSNIGWSLGTSHPYGDDPDRVPAAMKVHVLAQASSFPACLVYIPSLDPIFDDGFESGDTSAWSAVSL